MLSVSSIPLACSLSHRLFALCRTMVLNMVKAVGLGQELRNWAMLWLTAYTFLLRVPSEAIPMCRGSPDDAALAGKQTLIWREGDEVCIRMLRRKNKPKGSGVLRRKCCCQQGARADIYSSLVCPVHTLWDRFFRLLPEGTEPWKDTTEKEALAKLRELLGKLGIQHVEKYGTHDFRRGHAEARMSICSTHILVQRLSIMFFRT